MSPSNVRNGVIKLVVCLYLYRNFQLPASSSEIPAVQVEDDLSQRMNYAGAAQGLEAMSG